MELTPAWKFAVIAFAFLANVMLWIWTGIKGDALALGLSENWYNIVLTTISGFVTSGSALLAYLGLRVPTISSNQVSSKEDF